MNSTIQHLDRAGWGGHASSFEDYNYRHIWEFGTDCAARMGARSEHVAVLQDGEILGLADVRIKRVPVLRTGIAYINGGPLVRRNDERDSDRLSLCLKALIDEYAGRRGMVLRVMTPVADADWGNAVSGVFSDAGFLQSDSMRPYRTFLLDIARPPEEVRRGMAQKWRNGLNQSEKRNISIRSGTSSEFFRTFCDLFSRFVERKQFEVDLTPAFYLAVHEQLPACDRFQITLAEIDGTVVAGHVASLLGDTSVYLLGASSDEGLRTKASYLLQWEAIKAAQQRGLKWYDLGGIDPEGNPGVHHFKSGLCGDDVTAPGPFEYYPSDMKRRMVALGERMYRWYRKTPRELQRA